MATKTTAKKTKAQKETQVEIKSKPKLKQKPTPKQKATSKTTPKDTPKKLTFWPETTTREDKVSLLSFCLGMIVMTCFFVLDLQIRNYVYKPERAQYLKVLTHQLQNHRKARSHISTCNCNKPQCPKVHAKKPALKCPPVWQRKAVFNPQEYAPYDTPGALTISGDVCASLPKGAICPKNIDVFVNPKTSYSDEWWTKHWTGTYGISKVDERAIKYNKKGSVQENGQFSITDLPAGTYYVGATACVSRAPNKPCRNTRWGTQVSIEKDTQVSLKRIHPKR